MTDLTQTNTPKRISLLQIVGGALALTSTTIGTLWLAWDPSKPSKEQTMINEATKVIAYINKQNQTPRHFYLGETADNPNIRTQELEYQFMEAIEKQTQNLPRDKYGNLTGLLKERQKLIISDLNKNGKADGLYPINY